MPSASLGALRAAPHVRAVWRDAEITMSDAGDDDDDGRPAGLAAYDRLAPDTVWRDAIRLPSSSGDDDDDASPVTVAVIDTGIARTADLVRRVAARADLTPERDGVDRYGHGTHIAGLIAGEGRSGRAATGAAPDARLVSLKVAGWNGATDVSTVIAAMQWVVANLPTGIGTESAC